VPAIDEQLAMLDALQAEAIETLLQLLGLFVMSSLWMWRASSCRSSSPCAE
jgi:hypothetical protein